jgi:hypothetical protein
MTSRTAQPLSRARVWTCILTNQLATPGLGSLMARRVWAGTGQLLLALAGFVLIVVWFFEVMIQYYGQVTGDVPARPVGWIGEIGAILFVASWLWALVTSISLWRQAESDERAELKTVPPRMADLPGQPPKLS